MDEVAIHALLGRLIIIRYYREYGGKLSETFGIGYLLDYRASVVAADAHYHGDAA